MGAIQMHMIEANQVTNPGESMNILETRDFLAAMIVDHIDGVMAELLIHQYFAPTQAEWELL